MLRRLLAAALTVRGIGRGKHPAEAIIDAARAVRMIATLAGADRLLARARRAEVDHLQARVERLEAEAASRGADVASPAPVDCECPYVPTRHLDEDGHTPMCAYRKRVAALVAVTRHHAHTIRRAIRWHEGGDDVAWQVDLLRHVLAVAGEPE